MQLTALFPNVILVPTDLAALIGVNHAILVSQIHYWLKKGGHKRDGNRWIYNTYQDWQKQLPWLTIRGVRFLVKDLEDQGFIITTDKYNKLSTDRTKWYTLNYEKILAVQSEVSQEGSVTDTSDCHLLTLLPSLTDPSYHKTTQESNQETNPPQSGVGGKHGPSKTKEVSGEGEVGEEVTEGNIAPVGGVAVGAALEDIAMKQSFKSGAEATAYLTSKKMTDGLKSGTSPSWAMGYWRTVVPQLYEEVKFLAPFTAKETAQFKLFLKRSGGYGPEVMTAVIEQWYLFSERVRELQGLSQVPQRPDIGFLLKHVSDAVNWHLELKGNPLKTTDENISVQLTSNKDTHIINPEDLWNKPKDTVGMG